MKTYSVWYLEGDLGLYGEVVSNRTVEADTIREASQKVRGWSGRRDYLIAKKGTYFLEPGGGPLILFSTVDGKYFQNKTRAKFIENTP